MSVFSMIALSVLIISPNLWANSATVEASVEAQEIKYQAGGVEFVGYLAKPAKTSEKRPGVLVVHEWWGQTEYPRTRARMLAELGYVAMAVDMYGGRKIADHPKDAGSYMQTVMSDAKNINDRFTAALNTLRSQADVDPKRVAAIGYCFGGSVILDMAKQGVDLKAVVSFHGGLKTPTPAKRAVTTAKILVLNGADDKMIDSEQVGLFKAEMTAAGIPVEIINYPGAVHGFTNPEATELGKKLGIGIAYNADADKKSWAKLIEFFNANL